jgi:hypothetical protein
LALPIRPHRWCGLFAFLALAICLTAQPVPNPGRSPVIGSWFGRAVPVKPFCQPLTPGCPLPPEIIMLPSFLGDGTFIGINSITFQVYLTEAHGSWVVRADGKVEANYIWLQATDQNPARFEGAYRGRQVVDFDPRDPDRATGYI